MKTFAQIIDGFAQNVVTGDTFEAAVDGRFNVEWLANEIAAGRVWSEVPNGTQSSAKDNGDGTFTNPAPPVNTPKPVSLNKAQFQALYAANGNDLTKTLDNWPTA